MLPPEPSAGHRFAEPTSTASGTESRRGGRGRQVVDRLPADRLGPVVGLDPARDLAGARATPRAAAEAAPRRDVVVDVTGLDIGLELREREIPALAAESADRHHRHPARGELERGG